MTIMQMMQKKFESTKTQKKKMEIKKRGKREVKIIIKIQNKQKKRQNNGRKKGRDLVRKKLTEKGKNTNEKGFEFVVFF